MVSIIFEKSISIGRIQKVINLNIMLGRNLLLIQAETRVINDSLDI